MRYLLIVAMLITLAACKTTPPSDPDPIPPAKLQTIPKIQPGYTKAQVAQAFSEGHPRPRLQNEKDNVQTWRYQGMLHYDITIRWERNQVAHVTYKPL